MRFKARAWKTGLQPSAVTSADYEIVGAVAAGSGHGVALRADGTVATWGVNDYGQLGDGTTTRRVSPVNVTGGLDDVIAVAAGQLHTVALKFDGSVWSWGYNGGADGILGAGIPDTQRTAPVQVVTASGALTGVVAIAVGQRHTIALKSDGTVWVWGFGYYGALGQGNTSSQNRAIQVPGLTGVTVIAAGGWSSFALQTNGSGAGNVWAWGLNDSGQLLDGTTTTRYSPVLITSQASLVAAGVQHTFIRKPDGTVWGAGLNDFGQLGLGTTQTPQLALVSALTGVTGASKLAASGAHTLALTAAGEVWATGYNSSARWATARSSTSPPPTGRSCSATPSTSPPITSGTASTSRRSSFPSHSPRTAACGPGATTPTAASATASRPTTTASGRSRSTTSRWPTRAGRRRSGRRRPGHEGRARARDGSLQPRHQRRRRQ